MRVQIEMRGTTPLLIHNVNLADPDYEYTRSIKEITAKLKKTEDDRRAIERLEWFGGLYVNRQGPYIPASAVRKCIINAARIGRAGKDVERALHLAVMEIPLVYKGPRDPGELFKNKDFTFRAVVGVQRAKCIRVRPRFMEWALVVEAELLEDMLDFAELKSIVALAGRAEGLGDGRTIGFGRFEGNVKAA